MPTLVVLSAAMLLAMPAAASAEPVFKKYKVPTVGDAEINVEVMRPRGEHDAPVILTYSPYNTISETTQPNLANDDVGQRYEPRGYARAVADVLGTRNSSGCWDYGGRRETQSGVDLVNFLADLPWSNGKVAMIGGSYDGTTANMVASQGDEAPGLKAIVPVAAISRWYGYAYSHGIRYAGNTERPTDEGADTPLAFDFGLTRTPPTDPTDPAFIDLFLSRINPCDSVEHTERGYDDSPDYNRFWVERDYLRHAEDFRAAVLVAHGWQDYNVKQEEGVSLFQKLREDRPGDGTRDGVPFKRLYMFQDGHASPSARNWEPLLDRFFAHTLKGAQNGVAGGPSVITEGRTADTESTGFRSLRGFPPKSAQRVSLYLSRLESGVGKLSAGRQNVRSGASYTDTATQTEEESKEDPGAERNWLFYRSPRLARDVDLTGAAQLNATIKVDRRNAHLTPVLADVAPNGDTETVSRGFLNLLYRDGLARPKGFPQQRQGVPVQVSFKPQDQTLEAGHRLAVIVQSSNTAWAVPDDPGARVTVRRGARTRPSTLAVPIVDPPARTQSLFETP